MLFECLRTMPLHLTLILTPNWGFLLTVFRRCMRLKISSLPYGVASFTITAAQAQFL